MYSQEDILADINRLGIRQIMGYSDEESISTIIKDIYCLSRKEFIDNLSGPSRRNAMVFYNKYINKYDDIMEHYRKISFIPIINLSRSIDPFFQEISDKHISNLKPLLSNTLLKQTILKFNHCRFSDKDCSFILDTILDRDIKILDLSYNNISNETGILEKLLENVERLDITNNPASVLNINECIKKYHNKLIYLTLDDMKSLNIKNRLGEYYEKIINTHKSYYNLYE